MRMPICQTFGIEFPIFAFSHCRDVVAAVSRAGGLAVLGALAFSPEQLEIELKWIDEWVDAVTRLSEALQEAGEGSSSGECAGG